MASHPADPGGWESLKLSPISQTRTGHIGLLQAAVADAQRDAL